MVIASLKGEGEWILLLMSVEYEHRFVSKGLQIVLFLFSDIFYISTEYYFSLYVLVKFIACRLLPFDLNILILIEVINPK